MESDNMAVTQNGQNVKSPQSSAPNANSESIKCATRFCKAMSHPLRMKILCILNLHEITVGEITRRLGSTQSNISQHLSILRDKGILKSRKVSNQVFYRIDDVRTLQLLVLMKQVY